MRTSLNRIYRRMLPALVAATGVACDPSGISDVPDHKMPGDSAAIPARSYAIAAPQTSSGPVTIFAGESAIITMVGAECASIGSIVAVFGALSGVVSTNGCQDVGASLAVGPATADGFLSFAHIHPDSGAGSFRVMGSHPSFTVFLDDGFGDLDFNDSVLEVELVTDCNHSVTPLSQGEAEWANNQYDGLAGETIAVKGCALTALAMALNFAGVATDPGELNDSMNEQQGYQDGTGNVLWDVAARRPGGMLKFKFTGVRTPGQLARELCEVGFPIIVGVREGNHFVLATSVENGRIKIADPGHGNRQFLDHPAYDNRFTPRGWIADPPGDISSVSFVINDAAMLVAGPSGATGSLIGPDGPTGIPQSAHFTDAIENDVTGEPAAGSTTTVHIFQPASGSYLVLVRGERAGARDLRLVGFAPDGSRLPDITIPLTLRVNDVAFLQVEFSTEIPVRVL